MMLTLRNLFRHLRGRAPSRPAPRPPRKARLHLEALEGRDVPAVMNLTGYTFALPGATFHVTNEIPLNNTASAFTGDFKDAASGIDIPNVTGLLTKIAPNLDQMAFHGTGTKGLETEKVAFGGALHEAATPVMIGQLTESYSLPVAQWTATRTVESFGRHSATAGALTASPAAVTDAVLAAEAWLYVGVNPQPLPPLGLPTALPPLP